MVCNMLILLSFLAIQQLVLHGSFLETRKSTKSVSVSR